MISAKDRASMFTLHSQLAADTFEIGNFPLSVLLLMNDANYPWFILVPRRADIREIYQLDGKDQQQLLWESSALAEGLSAQFQADKLNIAALGNMVPQLHLHHIVRYRTDPAWPAPVWGHRPARHYSRRADWTGFCGELVQRLPMLIPAQTF